jgi:hypothetical protein
VDTIRISGLSLSSAPFGLGKNQLLISGWICRKPIPLLSISIWSNSIIPSEIHDYTKIHQLGCCALEEKTNLSVDNSIFQKRLRIKARWNQSQLTIHSSGYVFNIKGFRLIFYIGIGIDILTETLSTKSKSTSLYIDEITALSGTSVILVPAGTFC